MIEISFNLHPIMVHFTIALYVTSTLFYFISYFVKPSKISPQFIIVANWCLWMAAMITIGTLIAGFYAYYTVVHDATSHLAMTDHRNWAIATSVVLFVLALRSWFNYKTGKKLSILFLIGLTIGLGLVMVTAWRGGELVYRYGVGVKSLPEPHTQPSHDTHSHTH